MIAIQGYQILAKIHESENSVVYRGRREEDNLPVVVKIIKGDYPTEEELARYRKEYEITKNLNLDGVVKAYSLQKYRNTKAMILEDFGGESLKKIISSQNFTILGFLNLAIKISESLGEIHSANIIHKDINPSNIIFNPATGQVKIVDFSIATLLTKENTAVQNANILEGTLAYMSPEQTGRMNRYLDYRTDFYSLGVTFYELLTQQLPFEGKDAMEFVHSHIAKQPTAPDKINPEIPRVIANIVMKLLAKTAEDRYQSAWGLMADLEECLHQLQNTGEIEEFALARQDISDKFQIPQKLYGRQTEIKTLIEVFDRVGEGNTEMMLIGGYSGIGKSALVQEISKTIIRKEGNFIWGKFDQFQRSIPYSAVVKAFSELVPLLLSETEEKLKEWREKLLNALGSNGQIMLDVIPELELIIGPQPPVQELGPTEAQNRFNLVFQNFIRLFCQPEHPLVIFLDDLQWADSATLKLIKLMMTDDNTKYLFLIGAYRDNEVNVTHPLMMLVDGLRSQEEQEETAIVNEITLEPLELKHITKLIAETLHSDRSSVAPLAELVTRKTGGNPFFVNEFLKTLYQENLLNFKPEIIRWQWDMEAIKALDITDNVVDLMIGKLRKLPEETQKVLSLVACIGNQFDLNTLSLTYEKESSAAFGDLLPAVREGLILAANESEAEGIDPSMYGFLILNYKFLHDRVQQAAYSLIDESQKQAIHLKIGRLFLANTPPEYRLERVFDLVDHLNVGISLIDNEAEKLELAKLNLEAGRKAKDATAYVAAKEYLKAGLSLLNESWWESHYDLAFPLHKEAAEVEYLNSNFSESEKLIELSLERAKTALEKTEAYKLLILQSTLRAKYEEAFSAGKKALCLLGIDLPTEDLETAISQEVAVAKENLGEREIASLIEAPEMTVPENKMALDLITNLLTSTYLINPQLWTINVLKGVNIALKYGRFPEAVQCYTNYGIVLNAFFGDYKAGYEFGLLALNISEQFKNLRMKCKSCAALGSALMFWFKHIKDCNAITNEGYQAALESGDLEYAGYLLHNTILNAFFQGKNIGQLLEEIPRYLQFTQKTQNQLSTDSLLGLQLTLGNLYKSTAGKLVFATKNLTEEQHLQSCKEHQNLYSSSIYMIHKLENLYLYWELEEALKLALETEKKLPSIAGCLPVTEFNFFYSLILAAVYPEASATQQQEYWEKLQKNQEQMKIWADNCAANFEHKYLLVAAEMARISGKDAEAIDLYDRAIISASENEFIQNEALANELAAKFWLKKGKRKYAEFHLRDAYYGYQRWGASRKVEELENLYPQVRELLKTKSRSIDTQATVIHTSKESSAEMLDLASAIKASQAISSEIVLDKLLSKLMTILIENAGAEKGFLLLPKNEGLTIAAKASTDGTEVVLEQSQLVSESEDLPQTVINYVERSQSDTVLSDAASEGQFTKDPYIASHKLKSLLCVPILNAGKLVAVLYLENNLTVGAFTSDRLEILRLLSSQAAVSLENSLLYTSVEQKVQERTQELNEKNTRLEQTLRELQRTQAQLIQSEKMSSLGQLVAGVAHEINNPVGFIYGNLSPATEYVSDLLNLIEMYQEHYPEPVEEIEEELEAIELDFLVEDLQKLLNSMKVGAERIRDIVLSLRNFSRLDESDMKPVDIHEGIDSTLLILHTRIKEKSETRGIEIVKEYGKLPQVACYASQLNQVFMNIIVNAIDALQNNRDKEHKVNESPTLTIRTETTDSDTVKISIADNGNGMTEEVRSKIFDPFYTTKPVGSGTGLGLSISYSVVVEKHGGSLVCNSAPGEGAEFVIEIPVQPK